MREEAISLVPAKKALFLAEFIHLCMIFSLLQIQ